MRLSGMISAVDVHACGEPGRVIVGGVPDIPGATIFEKKVYLETHCDWLRKRARNEISSRDGNSQRASSSG